MAKNGPILILEDDDDDREIYEKAVAAMGLRNAIKFFDGGDTMLAYLKETSERPFIIIADINVPRMNGLELRRNIMADEHLRKKSIPFIYLTTIESKEIIDEVYLLTVQGYFVKRPFFSDIETQIREIFDYWHSCRHPNE
jgi:CheY-like chemotaxis protein